MINKLNWRFVNRQLPVLFVASITCIPSLAFAQKSLDSDFAPKIQPLLVKYCFECHSGDTTEAEVDLASFADANAIRKDTKTWIRIAKMLSTRQMPPKESAQLGDEEFKTITTWVSQFLLNEARANAGDPGPVVLRRLSNAEYTHSIRDLTELPSLSPTKEFPVDGAAGEGFTNTGEALVMSPNLVRKYLDAGKQIASHAVLTPTGIRFSEGTSLRDWTDEGIADVRAFYQGFINNPTDVPEEQKGYLFVEPFITAIAEARDALNAGQATIDEVAVKYNLNVKYLKTLRHLLEDEDDQSLLLNLARERWQKGDITGTSSFIDQWQSVLWKFSPIGHVGRAGAAAKWQEQNNPIINSERFQIDFPPTQTEDVVIFLSASDASDGNDSDYVLWQYPHLTKTDDKPILLSKMPELAKRMDQASQDFVNKTAKFLIAANAFSSAPDTNLEALAAQHDVDPAALQVWINYLGIGRDSSVKVTGHFTSKLTNVAGYSFINGWGLPATPSILANSSDTEVAIPGTAKPHRVTAHPSPSHFAAIGWQSPVDGTFEIDAVIADAHGCGNGEEWWLQHQTRQTIQTLWEGSFGVNGKATMETQTVVVKKGELISFILGPNKNNHACDLTQMDLTIREVGGEKRTWDLAKDISGNILVANPLPDSFGTPGVWHLYSNVLTTVNKGVGKVSNIPATSLLHKWLQAEDETERTTLAREIQKLALGAAPEDDTSPDAILRKQLRHLNEEIEYADLQEELAFDSRFGTHPLEGDVNPNDLVVKAPNVIQLRIPARIAAGRSFVVTGLLDATNGKNGTVQLYADTKPIVESINPGKRVITIQDSAAHKAMIRAFDDFRDLFPRALCYSRVVPVDEAVTLTLFYREDDTFARLFLTEEQRQSLDAQWDEFLFVAHEPTRYVVAFEQIYQFATQDRPDIVKELEPLEAGVRQRGEDFVQRRIETEHVHVEALIPFAAKAWRRPLSDVDASLIQDLYASLRASGLNHDPAIRLTLARILTSPHFLYKLESQTAGDTATPVSALELASRLSYFLTSSMPDDELITAASNGSLLEDAQLVKQVDRLMKDPRARRTAIQFFCQWLHIRNFDQNDDKNENLFPEFAGIRDDMYEESVLFFTNMINNDESVLDLLTADYTFVNSTLAAHYGISDVDGDHWRRVRDVKPSGRGGILTMATTLATNSGASRTSPILRGNWVYETLLGEKLPNPPADVPQLPEIVPDNLTARQLIELHSETPECAKCHKLIDPYGFALEQYDVLGRIRPIPGDTKTKLPDGVAIDGAQGLRAYLSTTRQDDFLRQFTRKLLGYALGREVQLSDQLLIDEIIADLKLNDYRISIAIKHIVLSPQFRNIRGRDFLTD